MSRASVRIAPAFLADLRGQIAWLEDHESIEYIDRLQEGIDEAIDLIGQMPRLGPVERRGDDDTMRKLLLRRLPFVIWYSIEDDPRGGGEGIWLLRLFHVRQDRLRTAPARRKKGR